MSRSGTDRADPAAAGRRAGRHGGIKALLIAAAAALLALSAAADEKREEGPYGEWRVRETYPAAPAPLSKKEAAAYVGRSVKIDPKGAVGLAGKRCDKPAVTLAETTAKELFGRPAPKGLKLPEGKIAVVAVTCGKTPLGVYLRRSDGTLVTRWHDTWFVLARPAAAKGEKDAAEKEAGKEPKAEAKDAKKEEKKGEDKKKKADGEKGKEGEQAKAGDKGKEGTKPEAKPPGGWKPTPALHLASCLTPEAAAEQWRVLREDLPELRGLEGRYAAVEVPGRGRMIRVYAVGLDAPRLAKICAALQKREQFCKAGDLP